MHDPALQRVIALADDHPIVRAALKGALAQLGGDTQFLEACDADSAIRLARSNPDLDLMLLDLHMPGVQGTATVRAVREAAPALPLVVMSADEDPIDGDGASAHGRLRVHSQVRFRRRHRERGAPHPGRRHVRPATARRRAGARDRTGDGNGHEPALGLTARQLDVLRLLGHGLSNKVIARELGITEGTVKVHLLAVFRALDVRNRTAAVLAAQRYRG